MPDTMLCHELDRIIANYQLRIQQQRIHVKELSADPTQQKQAQGQLAAMVTGLDKLRDYRKLFS
jgi:FKBP-type peptidyl-prolyl cis-trans isomerase (trigger factor)